MPIPPRGLGEESVSALRPWLERGRETLLPPHTGRGQGTAQETPAASPAPRAKVQPTLTNASGQDQPIGPARPLRSLGCGVPRGSRSLCTPQGQPPAFQSALCLFAAASAGQSLGAPGLVTAHASPCSTQSPSCPQEGWAALEIQHGGFPAACARVGWLLAPVPVADLSCSASRRMHLAHSMGRAGMGRREEESSPCS